MERGDHVLMSGDEKYQVSREEHMDRQTPLVGSRGMGR